MATPQDEGEPMRLRVAIAFAACVAFAFGIVQASGARADEHGHAPEDVEIHERFYSTWMRPDQPDQSCCNRRDCAPATRVRRLNGRWQAERDGAWLTIPPEKIEQNRASPDGRSHLCAIGATVLCFVLGAGT
jgi:hypothetical protein